MNLHRLCLPLLLAACAASSWDTGYVTVRYAGDEHKVGIKGDMGLVQGGYEATLRDGDYTITLGLPRKMDDMRRYPLSMSNVRLVVAHPEIAGGKPVSFEEGAVTVQIWEPEIPSQVRGTYRAQQLVDGAVVQIAGDFQLYVSRWE